MKAYAREGVGCLLLTTALLLSQQWGEQAIFPITYAGALTALLLVSPTWTALNPALAIADFWVKAQAPRAETLFYRIGAQLMGAIAGALLAVFAVRCFGQPADGPLYDDDLLCKAFLEGMGALLLTYVYLNARASSPPSLGAVAMGLAAGAGSAAVHLMAPAAFNPSIYVGLWLSGKLTWWSFCSLSLGALFGVAAGTSLFIFVEGSSR